MLRKLFVLLFMLGFVFSAPVEIDSCQVIDSPGEYILTANLDGLDGANSYCIQIPSDNVSLDCNGYSISGTGTGHGISLRRSTNATIMNCTITNYEYGAYGDADNSRIEGNTIYRNVVTGIYLSGGNNVLEENSFYGNLRYGAELKGSHNKVIGNLAYRNGGTGIFIWGDRDTASEHNEIAFNQAYENDRSGIYVGGANNLIHNNTAYENDLEALSGAGIYVFGGENKVLDNTAYDNTNGFYVEADAQGGAYGNEVINNHAYGNLIGLNILDYEGTVTHNLFEDNKYVDLMIGGAEWFSFGPAAGMRGIGEGAEAAYICINTIEGNTGSGGHPIFYSHQQVNLNGGTYSEILLCNATGSTISNVNVRGTDELKNNGLLLIFSDDVSIESTSSGNNFMGFGVLRSEGVSIKSSTATGSGLGIVSIGSHNLVLDQVTAANNKMDSDVFLQLLMVVMGGGEIRGNGQEEMRAPLEELPENGISALLFNTDYAQITDSHFSGSTAGLLFINSHHGLVSGGSAYNNILFGYGMIDCYTMAFEGVRAYGNKGTLQDIIGDSEPPLGLEMLEYLPPGAGIINLQSGGIMPDGSASSGLREIGEEPAECESDKDCEKGVCVEGSCVPCRDDSDCQEGQVCISNDCVAPFDGNYYYNVRSYNNNYGMVFLAEGNEWVDRSTIYDNSVLGILDASSPGRDAVGYTMPPSPSPIPQLIIVSDTNLYRNGERIFATLEETFEAIGRSGWAHAFGVLDKQMPKGTLEFEIIEASYIWSGEVTMPLPLAGSVSGFPWMLDKATMGRGPSSVTISLSDEAQAIYLLGDTTLPTLSQISLEDEEMGVDATLHIGLDAPAGKRAFNNKYFLVTALGPQLDGLGRPPSIDTFLVHYGSTSGYVEETMGLYRLDIRAIGEYCRADGDCTARGDRCFENMCVTPQCTIDEDCERGYCVGYQCVQCKSDSDCREPDVCIYGSCGPKLCTSDRECGEGQVCEGNACGGGILPPPPMESPDGAYTEPIREATLRQDGGGLGIEGEIIIKGYWVPVKGQELYQEKDEIYVSGLSQRDRTEFLEQLLGMEPGTLDTAIYLEVYGLFAEYTGVDDKGKPIEPDCTVDADCPECYWCSTANKVCLPMDDVECGVPGTGCPQGYVCKACECVPVAEPSEEECTSNRECPDTQYCADGTCKDVPCECGEVKNHECIPFECCEDSDCREGQECKGHKCVLLEECAECDDVVSEAEEAIKKAKDSGKDTSKAEELLAKAKEAREKGDCETALKYAEDALAAAIAAESPADLPPPIISTEVPSIDKPRLPNGEEVVRTQMELFPIVLLLILAGAFLFWYLKGRKGK